MKKIIWVLRVAYHAMFRLPLADAYGELEVIAGLFGLIVFFASVLVGVYFLAAVIFYTKDKLFEPRPDLASAQIEYRFRVGKDSMGPEEFGRQEEKFLDKNYVCDAYTKEVSYPNSLQCVTPNGVGVLNIQAKVGKSIRCCTRAIPRVNASIIYPQRQEIVFNAGFLIWLPILLMAIPISFVLIFMVANFRYTSLIVPLPIFFKSVRRGLRNTSLSKKLPKLRVYEFANKIEGAPFLVQLSDFHLTSPTDEPLEIKELPGKWPTENSKPFGTFLVSRACNAIENASQSEAAVIIITGDITDRGSSAEWEQFAVLIERCDSFLTGKKITMLAGNHDINFNTTRSPDPYLKLMSELNKTFKIERSKLAKKFGFDLQYQNEVGFARIIVNHKSTDSFNLMTLNTNMYESRHALSGALGLLGEKQISAARVLLTSLKGPLIIAMHHHFGIPAGLPNGLEDPWLVTIDASPLLDALETYALRDNRNKVLIIHGHRHRRYEATTISGNFCVFGLGSTTLGSEVEINRYSNKGLISKIINRKTFCLDGIGTIAKIGMTENGDWAISVDAVL